MQYKYMRLAIDLHNKSHALWYVYVKVVNNIYPSCIIMQMQGECRDNIFIIIQASNMVLKIRQKSVRPSYSKLSWDNVAALYSSSLYTFCTAISTSAIIFYT